MYVFCVNLQVLLVVTYDMRHPVDWSFSSTGTLVKTNTSINEPRKITERTRRNGVKKRVQTQRIEMIHPSLYKLEG